MGTILYHVQAEMFNFRSQMNHFQFTINFLRQLTIVNGWFNPLNPTGGIEDGAEAISEGTNYCY